MNVLDPVRREVHTVFQLANLGCMWQQYLVVLKNLENRNFQYPRSVFTPV